MRTLCYDPRSKVSTDMYLLDFWTFGIDDVDVIKKPSAQQIEQARKDNKPTKKRKDYI